MSDKPPMSGEAISQAKAQGEEVPLKDFTRYLVNEDRFLIQGEAEQQAHRTHMTRPPSAEELQDFVRQVMAPDIGSHPINALRGETHSDTPREGMIPPNPGLSEDYLQERAFHTKHYPDKNQLPPETPREPAQAELFKETPVSDHAKVEQDKTQLQHDKAEERQHATEFWQRTAQQGRTVDETHQQTQKETQEEAPVAKPRQPTQ